MPVATDWQNSILLEVGATLDARSRPELDVLTPNIPLWWSFYAVKASIFPFLQYLYTKRHLLMVLEGQLRNKVSGSMGGMNVAQSDSVKNVREMYKETTDEIKRIEKQSQAARLPVVQPATTLTPTSPGISNPPLAPLPVSQPALPNGGVSGGQGDPDAPAYKGDAFTDSNGPFLPGVGTTGF